MADTITGIRILCGILIFFFPAFSGVFWFLYLLGGLSDAIDGYAARTLGTSSPFGARFDTAADLIFALSVIIRIISDVTVPGWLLIWTGCIVAMKVINIAIGFYRNKCFVPVHSFLNRLCGLVVFFLPFFLGKGVAERRRTAAILISCILAGIAAVLEGAEIVFGNNRNADSRNQKKRGD